MAEATLEELQKQWPDWKPWRTGTLWCATRRGPALWTPADWSPTRGCLAMTLVEDSAAELVAALREQETIEAEPTATIADNA